MEKNFEQTTPRHRVRSKNRNFTYESVDEPILDLKTQYKIEFFFFTVDQAINAIELRFKLLNSHNEIFEFLYDVHKLKDMCKIIGPLQRSSKYINTL